MTGRPDADLYRICTSAVRGLVELWLASADGSVDRLTEAYDRCFGIARWAFAPDNHQDREQFILLVLRQAAADLAILPTDLRSRMEAWYADLVQIGELPYPHGREERLYFWARQVIPRLDGI